MIPEKLDLRYAGNPLRTATAWLVYGDSAEIWLNEICSWDVDQSALRILPFSSEANGSGADSLLVLIDGGGQVPLTPHSRPYGYLAERILAPVDADIFPPVQDSEWKELLPDLNDFYLWHASRGIVRFSPESLRRIEDLFQADLESEMSWDHAVIGLKYTDRLFSVSSLQPVWSLAEVEAAILNQLEVGKSLRELPPAPGERPISLIEHLIASLSFVQRIALRAFNGLWKSVHIPSSELPGIGKGGEVYYLLFVVGAVLLVLLTGTYSEAFMWLLFAILIVALAMLFWTLTKQSAAFTQTSKPPTPRSGIYGNGESGLASKATAYFAGIIAGIRWRFQKVMGGIVASANLFQRIDQQKREREVNRLLRMLENDPEMGLRYAIPFGGEPGRGRAWGGAGNELVDRFFSAFSFSAGPVNYWNINSNQQHQLIQRYRDLAAQEERAGRHRRAASIYSKLLGDWSSAAHVLKNGHHYPEAAAIFQERLHNIPDAARCYELAGIYQKAIELYLNVNMWIAAGDLCTRIRQEVNAETYYREAVNHAISINDIQTAVNVLENKLRDIDGAFDVLSRSWPHGPHADNHFELWFELAARHHRHELAGQRIQKTTFWLSVDEVLKVLPHLRRIAIQYPQADVQHLAGEKMLELISSHLPDVNIPHCRQLVSFLPALASGDRLLPRDCERYVDRRRLEKQSPPGESAPKTRSFTLVKKSRFQSVEWILPVRSCSKGWIGLTSAEKQSQRILHFGTWSGTVVEYPCDLGQLSNDCRLLAIDEFHKSIWLSSPVKERHLEWPENKDVWMLKSPPQSQQNWIGLLTPSSGDLLLMSIDFDGMHQFTEMSSSMKLGHTYSIGSDYVDPGPPGTDYLIGANARAILYRSGDDEILSFRRINGECMIAESHSRKSKVRNWMREFTGRSVSLSSFGNEIPYMLLMGTDSVRLFTEPRNGTECDRVHTDWSNPEGIFLSRELYLIVDESRLALYSIASREPRIVQKYPTEPAIAVAAIGEGRFSVLRSDGTYEVWQLC